MMTVLVAVRDFLLALAFAWVGVTLERAPAREPSANAPTCSSASRACGHANASRPQFSVLGSDER